MILSFILAAVRTWNLTLFNVFLHFSVSSAFCGSCVFLQSLFLPTLTRLALILIPFNQLSNGAITCSNFFPCWSSFAQCLAIVTTKAVPCPTVAPKDRKLCCSVWSILKQTAYSLSFTPHAGTGQLKTCRWQGPHVHFITQRITSTASMVLACYRTVCWLQLSQ
jgi:hypothetical protein